MDYFLTIVTFLTGTVIPFLFVLTMVVFFHELGHFLVARWCGVGVNIFSIGFGRELFGWTDRHNTRWRFAMIPLGGYVKFIDDSNAASVPDPQSANSLSDDLKDKTFADKSLARRSAIVAAGPIANFILAIVIFAGMFLFFGKPISPIVIGSVEPNSAAEAAGLQPGDVISKANGQVLEGFQDLRRAVSTRPGQEITLSISRNGNPLSLNATPSRIKINDGFGGETAIGRLGVRSAQLDPSEIEIRTYSLPGALLGGVSETWFVIERTFSYLGGILAGRESAEQLGGPIMIANVSGKMASHGATSLFNLIAVISISIGLINLFPIPMLDGGHLLFYAYEAVFGHKLNQRAQEVGFQIGFALLILMVVFVTRNDIIRLTRVWE